jgi:hypothetical protein
MITDAQFVDLNQNATPDLVLVGEWLPITIIYDFEQLQTIKNTDGFYNCLTINDINNDKQPDIIAGNLGKNTNLRASAAQPVQIFVKDFDKNGSTEPIVSYYRQNINYTFASKDELISQLPAKRKNFVEYAKYAQATFADVFAPDELTDALCKKTVQTQSLVLMNVSKGNFVVKPLPIQAQFAPIFAILPHDFNKDGNIDLLLGGNIYEVIPKIGRLGASYGTLLLGNGQGDFVADNHILPHIQGAVRDIKMLPNGGVLIARNNDYLQIMIDKNKK